MTSNLAPSARPTPFLFFLYLGAGPAGQRFRSDPGFAGLNVIDAASRDADVFAGLRRRGFLHGVKQILRIAPAEGRGDLVTREDASVVHGQFPPPGSRKSHDTCAP